MTATGREGESLKGRAAFSPGGGCPTCGSDDPAGMVSPSEVPGYPWHCSDTFHAPDQEAQAERTCARCGRDSYTLYADDICPDCFFEHAPDQATTSRQRPNCWTLHDTALVGTRDERVRIVGFERNSVRVEFCDLDLRLDVPYGALREER